MWNLGILVENEVIAMLAETERQDFNAMAHFHLGAIHEIVRDDNMAEQEFQYAMKLFEQMPKSPATEFYIYASEIELAGLEAQRGLIELARNRLRPLPPDTERSGNFLLQRPYHKASAQIERQAGQHSLEQHHLRHTIAIGHKGVLTLY